MPAVWKKQSSEDFEELLVGMLDEEASNLEQILELEKKVRDRLDELSDLPLTHKPAPYWNGPEDVRIVSVKQFKVYYEQRNGSMEILAVDHERQDDVARRHR